MTPDESDEDGDAESTDEETEAETEPETEPETESESEETTGESGGGAAGQQHQRAGATAGGFLGTREESDLVKEWVIFVAATIGLIGIASGLLMFLYGAIDEAVFTRTIRGNTNDAIGFDMVLLAIGSIGIAVSTLWGVYFGWNLDLADDLSYKTAGLSGAAGTVVMFILAGFLMSTAFDNADLEFAGLIINAIVAALAAGAGGAGAVWIARNQSPSGTGEELDSPGPVDANPSD